MDQACKPAVEAAFDTRFSETRPVAYNFARRDLAPKDRAIVDFLRGLPVAGRRGLDVGPGTGRWLGFLRDEGASFLAAVDISAASLTRCAPLCDATQKADLERDRLDFSDAAFDLVVSFEVLEHLADPSNYMAELVRVTAPGGALLFSVSNVVSFISRVRLVLGGLPPSISLDPTHVRHYRQAEATALLARHGLAPRFIPTSFSLDPRDPKSRWRCPSGRLTAGLDDSLLFYATR